MTFADDYAHIANLLAYYCYLCDFGRTDQVADEIFAPDGILDFGDHQASGREALHEWFTTGGNELEKRSHHVTNISVRVRDDSAMSLSYVTTHMWLRATSHEGPIRGADTVILGVYDDQLTRTESGWRIAFRQIRPLGPGGLGAGVPSAGFHAFLERKLQGSPIRFDPFFG
jgi:hypothetical protein